LKKNFKKFPRTEKYGFAELMGLLNAKNKDSKEIYYKAHNHSFRTAGM
jgi:hypothetical protein